MMRYASKKKYWLSLAIAVVVGYMLAMVVDIIDQWNYYVSEGWSECHVELSGVARVGSMCYP